MSMKRQHSALEFLSRLARNNNRVWFAEHKSEYDDVRAMWLDEVDRYIARLAQHDPRVAHQQARHQAYRIYRDTRFSPDKTPYKTFFSAAFQVQGTRDERAGYYLQMDNRPEEGGLYGGFWCPDSAQLRKLRQAIVDNIDELESILAEPALRSLYGPGWCGPALKTAPAGWPKDHPQIELLRLKSYGKFHPLPPEFFARPDWPEEAADRTAPLRPLVDFINYSLDEEI